MANTPRALRKEQVSWLRSLKTFSNQVRYLNALGFTRGEIKRLVKQHLGLDKRYQHIRNILVTEVKNPSEQFLPTED